MSVHSEFSGSIYGSFFLSVWYSTQKFKTLDPGICSPNPEFIIPYNFWNPSLAKCTAIFKNCFCCCLFELVYPASLWEHTSLFCITAFLFCKLTADPQPPPLPSWYFSCAFKEMVTKSRALVTAISNSGQVAECWARIRPEQARIWSKTSWIGSLPPQPRPYLHLQWVYRCESSLLPPFKTRLPARVTAPVLNWFLKLSESSYIRFALPCFFHLVSKHITHDFIYGRKGNPKPHIHVFSLSCQI